MTTPLTSLPELRNRYALRHQILPDDPRISRAIAEGFVQVGASFLAPLDALRPEQLARHDARHHPRSIAYRVPMRERALGHHWSRPGSVLADWAALHLHGVDDVTAGADVTVLCTSDRSLADDHLAATLRRRRPHHTAVLLQEDGRPVLVTDRMQTLAGCLTSLRAGEHAWDTLATLDLDPVAVMSVQLIDLFCRRLNVSHEEIRRGLVHRFSARTLATLLEPSCPLAESRPETILRLLAREAVADLPGVHLESQVPLYRDGTIGDPGVVDIGRTLVTVWDVAERRLRVGLQHDGEHHLGRDQRDKDAEITADAVALGWNQIRTSAGMLRKTAETKQRVRTAVLGALARGAEEGGLR